MQINYYDEIKKRFGNIRRARNYYLYTEKNIRILDMYLDGGFSIIGRRVGESKLVLKQKIDKGLWGCFPTQAEHQLTRVLNTFFPKHTEVRFYSTVEKAYSVCRQNLSTVVSSGEDILYRFGADAWKQNLLNLPCFLVKPIFPCNYGIMVYNPERVTSEIPVSDNLISAELFAIVRSFYDLKYKMKNIEETIQKPPVTNLETLWERHGIYLMPKVTENEYTELFMQALNSNILISPDFRTPSILPILPSYSELQKFLKNRT